MSSMTVNALLMTKSMSCVKPVTPGIVSIRAEFIWGKVKTRNPQSIGARPLVCGKSVTF